MISLNLKAVVICFNLCSEVFSGRRCLSFASSGVAGSESPGNPAMPSLFKADLKDYIPKTSHRLWMESGMSNIGCLVEVNQNY